MTEKINKEDYKELQNLISKKKYKKAEKRLKNWLKSDPENVIFHLDLGFVLVNRSKTDKAIEHYKKVMRLAPENPSGHAGLGFVYSKQGKKQKAIKQFKKSLEMDPSNAMIHFELGEIYFAEDNYEAAKKSYLKAIQFGEEENEPETLHRLMQVDLGMENYEKTIEMGKKLLNRDPNLISIHNLMGTAFFLQNDWEKAIKSFKKYLEKVPDDESAKKLLKKAKEQQKN